MREFGHMRHGQRGQERHWRVSAEEQSVRRRHRLLVHRLR